MGFKFQDNNDSIEKTTKNNNYMQSYLNLVEFLKYLQESNNIILLCLF